MAIIKNQLQVGADTLYSETSADMVKYSDTTVADVLDSMGGTATAFINNLLQCANDTEVRKLLKVGLPAYPDLGTDNINWLGKGSTCLRSAQSVFGEFSLFIPNSTSAQDSWLISNKGITLGGKDFTIDLWGWFATAATTAAPIIALVPDLSGTASFPRIMIRLLSANGPINGVFQSAAQSSAIQLQGSTTAADQDWHHFELVYQHSSGKWIMFQDGQLEATVTGEYFDEATFNYIILGVFNTSSPTRYFRGYIDEVRISDGIARHTANFSRPTAKYDVDEYTKVLLHFD